MAKDPAFLFYSSDFYMGTLELSDAQVGQYVRLMCLQHQKGHLPESLMRGAMGGELDADIMRKYIKDETGLYYNARLETEITKRREYCAGRGRNRKICKSSDDDIKIISKSYDEHMVNEDVIVNDNTNTTLSGAKTSASDERFDAFWTAYPKKVGKGAARAAWKKIKAKAETLDAILAAIESQKSSRQWLKDDGQYIPNPATWLNQERWEDGETSGCQPEESVFSMPKTFEG